MGAAKRIAKSLLHGVTTKRGLKAESVHIREVTYRQLTQEDIASGLLTELCQDSGMEAGASVEQKSRYASLLANPDVLHVVAQARGRLVGIARLLVEHKFIHECGRVGHVEDVLVAPAWQDKGVLEQMINALVGASKRVKCYKIILNCQEFMQAAYEECGFKLKEAQMVASLPVKPMDMPTDDVVIRRLVPSDRKAGFLECLAQLTSVGDVSESRFLEQLKYINASKERLVLVAEDTTAQKIVGTGALIQGNSLLVHPPQPPASLGLGKTSRNVPNSSKLYSQGHIEDVVVDKLGRGKRIGKRLIHNLLDEATLMECDHVILNCTASNVDFYVKCGFEKGGIQMVRYLDNS